MKKKIVVVLLILILAIGLTGCLECTPSIRASKLEGETDEYYNMTEQILADYSHLKQAIINTGETVELPSKEYKSIVALFNSQNNTILKYEDEFFEISFSTC